jgi:hypothetical protein
MAEDNDRLGLPITSVPDVAVDDIAVGIGDGE